MKDFSLEKYEQLLRKIQRIKIKTYTIKELITDNPQNGIVLRHDVDRKPENALRMAVLEHRYGVRSTYYFRIVAKSFSPAIITKIAELGHEIGYHYEELSTCNGNLKKAIEQFGNNLEKLRKFVEISTISMHGKPMSQYDNRDLWKKYDWHTYNLLGEAYLSINYENIYYFTDTGRSWDPNAFNIRDKVKNGLESDVKDTDDLISFLGNNEKEVVIISVHPERWFPFGVKWFLSFLKDWSINVVKLALQIIYK